MAIKFIVETIETERRTDGNTLLKASTMDNNEKVFVTISIKNIDLENRAKIRQLLIERYDRYKKYNTVQESIKVGDLI